MIVKFTYILFVFNYITSCAFQNMRALNDRAMSPPAGPTSQLVGATNPIHTSIFYQGFSKEADPGILGQYQLANDLQITKQNFVQKIENKDDKTSL